MKIRSHLLCLLLSPATGLIGCAAEEKAAPAAEATAPVTTATKALGPETNIPVTTQAVVQPKLDPAVDAALRRSYGGTEMALQKCMKTDKSGAIVGDNCPPGLLIFGPYVRVPGDSNVRLTFDIQSAQKLGVTADIVSSVGTKFHGAMDEQAVDPKAAGHVSYAAHMSEEADALEARVWLRSDRPASFKITNLELKVQ
jgi:hypothetical protein